jgi:hypothetical protein
MKRFRIVDERGNKFTYAATDMRMALAVHYQLHGTDVAKAKVQQQGEQQP